MTGQLTLTGGRFADRPADETGWLRIEDGVVVARGAGRPPRSDGDRFDAGGGLLVPGFVDMHVHGGGGGSADPSGLRPFVETHRAHGTTASVLSLVSAPVPQLVSQLAALVPLVRADPLLLGVHLEGPFLAPGARGAHDPAALTAPTPAAVESLIDAGGGTLVQITIAPELPGAISAIGRLVSAGIRVAIGHTVADEHTARSAFDAGATILTHAYNAMPPMLHRAPGPIGAAIADDRVTLELIADGHHVHPIVIRGLFRLAPGRVALITDAMPAAGSHDGRYRLGAADVTVRDGVARLRDGSLAGSTLTMDAALRGAVSAGVPLDESVRAATLTPARAVGRTDIGRLSPGDAADVVLLDRDLQVEQVWARGRAL